MGEVAQLRPVNDQVMATRMKARADSTNEAYEKDWARFKAWCEATGHRALPASPQVVAEYFVEITHDEEPIAITSVHRYSSSIAHYHKVNRMDDPTKDIVVKETLQGLDREFQVDAERGRDALSVDQLKAMARMTSHDLSGMRDKAILLLGFVGAFRRSELSALCVEDLKPDPKGLTALVERSKRDQTGKGHVKAIRYGKDPECCPVQALNDYLRAAGITTGPIFRPFKHTKLQPVALTGHAIAKITKRYAAAIGIDVSNISAHSLRVGFVTSSAEAGASADEIMVQTDHHDYRMVKRYTRRADAFRNNAVTKLEL